MGTVSSHQENRTALLLNPAFADPRENETILRFQTPVFNGASIEIDLTNGMKLNLQEFTTSQPVFRHEAPQHTPSMGMGFCLRGRLNANMQTLRKSYVTKPGESSLFYIGDISGSYLYFREHPILRIFIEFTPELFFTFLNDERDMLPADLLKAVERDRLHYHRSEKPMTHDMALIAGQILNCPYHGAARNFFFQAKAFELAASKMHQLQRYRKIHARHPNVKSVDIERIIHAKEILAQNLHSPPSITQLAVALGASKTKFYQDFCRIHGDTPTNYLRDIRMRQADRLMREEKKSIKEIAFAVGYANVSYFAKVFRAYFSVPPSVYYDHIHSGKLRVFSQKTS